MDIQEHSKIEVGSNRSFGIVFVVVFLIIALFPLVGGGDVRTWALICAGVFGGVSALVPAVLAPLNKLWFRFGLLLSRIVNPIVMFLMYAIAIVPIGLFLRALGRDLLSLRLDDTSDTYWIERSPPGPEPDSLKEQF